MSFLPTSNRAGCLAGIYLVNAVVAPLPVFYQVTPPPPLSSSPKQKPNQRLTRHPKWTASNFAGATKRALAAAVVSGSFSLGNIIGPQTFQARDAAGGYRPAKLAVVGTQAGCAAVTVALFAYYVWQNRRRGLLGKRGGDGVGEDAYLEREAWARMTDRENRRFRYSY